jgi:hypothetical protein
MALETSVSSYFSQLTRLVAREDFIIFKICIVIEKMSRGSSGSIVSDYGLDDRVIEVRSPTEAEDFSSSPCVQTGSEAHPASYPMGTGGVPSPGAKRGWGVTLTTHRHIVAEVKHE